MRLWGYPNYRSRWAIELELHRQVITSLTKSKLIPTNLSLVHLEDTVSLIIWSAVELAVTLICVGIPTVRPLYRVIVHGSNLEDSESGYVKHNNPDQSSNIPMQDMAKNNTTFRHKDEGTTALYISRNNNNSDEEVLVGQRGKDDKGIRVREEVRVDSNY